MPTVCFNQEAVKELKARLKWILKLGSEKKVFLALSSDNPEEEVFRPVKAVTVLEYEQENCKVLDIGFQYKGSGKTLSIRNVCAFNWSVLNYSHEKVPEKVKLTLFCLVDKASPESIVPKTYTIKFTDCPQDQYVSENYVMIS
ncbi:hypothetical protein JOC37_002426 [Desulfohalotomaculum tongense]|uniref:hypothetical protein n=1 Tax=Desulforadius tongensis TaxID=1216062 RepID=UPI00195C339D|nr:hypothetical protein [Desulforadius tongensis]MBM7856003.1 hypothetical protein [Desulforadius tongensis]